MLRRALLASILIPLPLLLPDAQGKEQPLQTITWPEAGTPILRFTFSKFKEIGGLGNQRTFMTETTAENLWTKIISNTNYSLYLFDKNKVRIGEATIAVNNVRRRND
jgi:hypothetical protein